MRLSSLRNTLVLGMSVFALGMVGCSSNPPAGRPQGVTEAGNRVHGETNAPEADPTSLLQFADQTSEALSMRLVEVKEIKDSPTKVVIVLGALTNQTRTPRSDFEAIRRRIFTRLVNSNVRSVASVVEDPDVMNSQRARYAPEQPVDRLDEGSSGTPMGQYDPKITYALQGNFSELKRPGTSTYVFDFTVTQLSSGRIVFADQFEFKQIRN